MSTKAKAKVVKLYRWKHPTSEVGNFGDEITSVILERIFGVTAIPASLTQAELIGAGSILDMYARHASKSLLFDRIWNRISGSRGLHVWGAGFLAQATRMIWPQKVRIHAVRGALTAKRLGIGGLVCGDPGILASRLVHQQTIHSSVCVVPHYRDYEWVKRHIASDLPRNWTLVHPLSPVDEVLREIASSECVVSSSLHGLIVADSFNKPCIWASAKYNYVRMNPFKFEDYQSTRGSAFNAPLEYEEVMRTSPERIQGVATKVGRNLSEWQEELVAAFPFESRTEL